MKDSDLANLDNQELTELLVTLEEMDNVLQEQENLLKESENGNEN